MFAAQFLTLLYLSNNVFSQVTYEALDTIFCSLSTMEDLFIKPGNSAAPRTNNKMPLGDQDIPLSEHLSDEDLKPTHSNEFLAKEFNDVTKSLYNLTQRTDISGRDEDYQEFDKLLQDAGKNNNNTRRIYGFYTRFEGYYDERYANSSTPDYLERLKISRIVNQQLQYLVHTRHKIEDALQLRKNIRSDKRFQLGYLFNRLRRLKTEQLKMVTTAYLQRYNSLSKDMFSNIRSLLRMYEKVVRYDVDVKDTVDYIRTIFAIETPYDIYAPRRVKGNKGQ